MKLTTITLGALAAVATLTGGANAQPNLQHRQLIQVTEPAGLLNERRLSQIGYYGDEMDDDESIGTQIGYYGDEMDDDESGRRLLSLEQWEARKPNRQANRANRQARQAKRQVRKQTRQNRLDVWEARKPIRQAKRENRQGRKVIRQAKLAQYKAIKRAQRKAIRPRRLRVYGLTLEEEEARWEAQEADEDDFEAVGRSCADYPMSEDC